MSKQWRCFFCDEVFTNRHDAWLHFGEENCETDIPACVDPLRTDERKLLSELRELRAEVIRQMQQNEEKEYVENQLEIFYSDLRLYFGADCGSMWVAGDRYKSALNHIADLEKTQQGEV